MLIYLKCSLADGLLVRRIFFFISFDENLGIDFAAAIVHIVQKSFRAKFVGKLKSRKKKQYFSAVLVDRLRVGSDFNTALATQTVN